MVYSVADFASKVRTKYPKYKDVPDLELTRSVIEEYPEYSSQVKIPKEYTGGTMFSPKAASEVGSFESGVSKKFSTLKEQGKQQAQEYQRSIAAPAPTAEQVGIRRAPSQVKDKISSFFKTSENRDVQIFGELAGDVGKAAQTAVNFGAAGVRDAATGLGNIRKQISSEGYGSTIQDITTGVKEAAPKVIDTASQAFQGDKGAQDKIVQFIEKYPDVAIFGGKGAIDLAKGAKNLAKNLPKNLQTAKTLWKNPSVNIIDEMGKPTGKTVSARQIAGDFMDRKFKQGAESFLAQHGPSPRSIKGNAQAQGRRRRPDSKPPQPVAGGPMNPTPPTQGPGGAGATFDGTEFVAAGSNWLNKKISGVKKDTKSIIAGIPESEIKGIQRNPYVKEYRDEALRTTTESGIPTDLKELQRQPLQQVGNTLLTKIDEKISQLSETGPLYKELRKIKGSIDFTNAPTIIEDILKQNDVFVKDGMLDFSDSAFIVGADTAAIKQAFERINSYANKPLTPAYLLNLRKALDSLINWESEVSDHTVAIVKKMRKAIDDMAKKQIPALAKLDDRFSSEIQELNNLKEGIFYREARRRNQPRDNFISIIKNITGESRGKMRERLLKIMPDLVDRVDAINFIPKIMKSYASEPSINEYFKNFGFGGIVGGVVGGNIGGVIGGALASIFGRKIATSLRKSQIEDILSNIGPDGVARLKEIDAQIKANKQIDAEDTQFLDELKQEIDDAIVESEALAAQEQALKEQEIAAEAAKKEQLAKRAKQQEEAKKQKIETQKRRFDSAIKSGIYEEIQPMKTPLKEGDLTEFYGEVTKRYTDRSLQKVDTEDADNLGIYEVGKVARRKGGDAEQKSPETTPDESGPDGSTSPTAGDVVRGEVKVKGYKQAEYKKAAEDMLGLTIEQLSEDGQALFQKAINAKTTKNRLSLVDELLFNYGTVEAKSAYLLDIAEQGNQKDIQDAIDSLTKYGFGKENPYTPDEHAYTIAYLQDLLETKTMDQPSLFDTVSNDQLTNNDQEAAGGTPQGELQNATKVRVDQDEPTGDATPVNQQDGGDGGGSVSVGGGKGDGGQGLEKLQEYARKMSSYDDFVMGFKVFNGLGGKVKVVGDSGELLFDGTTDEREKMLPIGNKGRKKFYNDAIKSPAKVESSILSKKTKDNIQKTATEILEKKNYSMDIADYTNDEIQTFKTYSGVSGLTAEAGILDQFYTPSTVIKAMWNLIGKYHDGPVQLALEPAAGIGRIALVGPEDVKFDMFEIDKTAGTIAQILNQNSNITIGDFQDLFMDGRKPKAGYNGKYYDIAISNPPYKTRQTKQRGLGELQEFDRFEDYFTYRQLQMVKPGGVVVTIVPSAFLDKGSYKAKEMIASIGKLVDAYRLPEGTFPDTQIGTDILVFRKEPGDVTGLIDKNFFKNNPAKILGEEKPATDRFGKPIMKVVGEKNAVTKIGGEFPKTITKSLSTPTIAKPQEGLFAKATPNDAKIKKPNENKPILSKNGEVFETQTITMGAQDPKILQYQKDVNVLGHLDGYTIDDIASDPNGLNYLNGKIYTNYHYLQGNIREKLADLQRDHYKGKIDKTIYDRQKSKLEAILPQDVGIMDIEFSPFDQKIINMPTGEYKTGYEYNAATKKNEKIEKPVTIRNVFLEWLRDNKPRSITSSQYKISRILDGKVEKGDGPIKSKIQIDAQKAFNAFMREGLSTKLQEEIAKNYNYTYNSYIKPDNKSQPLVVSDVSTKFKGGKFKFTDAQIEGINHLTNKGAGLIAYGVGVGKTITGLGATIVAMQKGWTKRPLFVVPKATLQHTWIGTIKELFPNYKIVNLGGLGVPDIKRLTKEYGADPKNWIKDGEIAITTFQGLKNITLKPENESLLMKDLSDVMVTSTGNAKKDQKKMEKVEMEAGKLLKTAGKSEIYIEDLGIDHLTIDEVHNMKNIFQSAEINKEDGQFNPFGGVLKGTSSDLGRKAYLASQYVMRNNNNRGVYALSATPFNNQPIEVYNLLALMAKKRLEDMGIKNINDFFTAFSYIQTEKVISPANFREIVERPVMKSFSNVAELQKLLTEFIDYKDSATAITMQQRPDKVVKRHIIKPSELQQKVNSRIRDWVADNQDKEGVYLVSMGQSIMNATSPYFVNSAYSHIPEPTNGAQIFRDSPKLQMALDMTKATLESGKGNVFWFMEQGVDYHPMIVDHIQESLGLKKGEVAFISGKITQDKKDEIAEGFRQGKVKVLVGGKTTAEGIDLQKHGVTTLFFSLNWNPTTTVQAGGRVWRPGNPRDKVYEAYLLSEDSGDLWLMQKYEEKASRINDIFSYQGRVFEDPSMTDGEAKMALLTDPKAKAEQQMNMDKIDIETKIEDYKSLVEKNSARIDILDKASKDIVKIQENIDYYTEKQKSAYGGLAEYQKEKLEEYKTEISRIKRKVDEIVKKHDKDYSGLDRQEAITKIMEDLNETSRKAVEEQQILSKEAENIKEKLPEYEKYFMDEKAKIDALKLTPQQQVEEYKKFLDTVKVI